MVKFLVAILGITILQLISESLARPENYQLSEKQITKLRKIATQWSEVVNFEKNPCENFYNFVCSNQEYPDLHRNISVNITEVILNVKTDSVTETERKYLKYSTICRTFKEMEREEFMKWFKLENSIGSWPAFVEDWDDSKFNLQQAIAELNSYGYPVVFIPELIFDENFEPTLEISMQDMAGLLDIETEMDIFKSKFEKLGVKKPEDVLTDAVLFEKTFKKASESLELASDKRIKFSELKDYFPEVDWNKQIEIMYGGKLPDDFTVLIKNHEKLKKIYKTISELSPKVIANYFFCAFIDNLNANIYPNNLPQTFFRPVIKQAFLKYVYDQNQKDILKGMYITILETVQEWNIPQNYKIRYSAEQIAMFLDEEIFGLTNEEDLATEYNEVFLNSNECIKNYHHLQKIYKKRLAKPFFNLKNYLFNIIENEIIVEVFYKIPTYSSIEDPSPFLFLHTLSSVIGAVFDNIENPAIHSNETINCLSKQIAKELDQKEKGHLLGIKLILKTFAEWTKNYSNIVQEENKILKEYDLSSEELFVVLIAKRFCEKNEIFAMLITAHASSPEYSQHFDCAPESKMNAATKCNL